MRKFEDKYLRGGKSGKQGGAKNAPSKMAGSKLSSKQGGMENMDRRIPAQIPDDQTKLIKEYTKKAFKALNSKGVVRIDYIIDKEDKGRGADTLLRYIIDF